MTFYYTYGLDPEKQAFKRGWSEVVAADRTEADRKYLARHPLVDGFIPCAFVYSEKEFQKSTMAVKGNFGAYCHEIIT